MQEKENILRIFRETKEAMKEGNSALIKDLSNQTINTASLTNDPDNIAVAVIVYSLGKILERHQYQQFAGWSGFYGNILQAVDATINDLEKNNDQKIATDLGSITKSIGKLSGKLRIYIQDVFRKASINKASRIYEHGISMERTAALLGITLYELASYAGQSRMDDVPLENTMDVQKRIKMAEEMFE